MVSLHARDGSVPAPAEVAYQIAAAIEMRLPDLFAFNEPRGHPAFEAGDALAELLEDCGEATAAMLLDLVRFGLRLAGVG